MKKILILLILTISVVFLESEILLELNDPAGDDYGKGDIKYPENPMFNQGLFDLTGFRMEKAEGEYLFSVTFAGKINPVEHAAFIYDYNLSDDFILPLIHIYIDQDHKYGSGSTETIRGVNATISPESAWERAVVIASMPARMRARLDAKQPEIARNIIIPDEIEKSRDRKTLTVAVDERRIGDFGTDWGFTIAVLSQEFSQTVKNNIYIREIKSTPSQFYFGGGSSSLLKKEYDPNIIDLLDTPLYSQQEILSDYDQDDKKFVELRALYPSGSELKGKVIRGIVKQLSEDKIVINLGSDHGVEPESRLLIDNRFIAVAEDVFPELCIAYLKDNSQRKELDLEMEVTIIEKAEINVEEEKDIIQEK